MNEPIKARVALPCVLRSPAPPESERRCVTKELTRDVLLVLLPAGEPSLFVYPGLDLVAEVELPADCGRGIRHLRCPAQVRSLERTRDGIEVVLDVKFMAITASDSRPHTRWS